ncbi:MAG: sigma-70 family RNA polymerase sigma factor [Planctomycetota bacterium]
MRISISQVPIIKGGVRIEPYSDDQATCMTNFEISNDAGRFATTRWGMVADAGAQSTANGQRALKELCEIYWRPLYAFAKRKVRGSEEAQDLTQAFFLELLEKNYVAAAEPNRGKFRAFLLTAFKHFVSKQREKHRAQKRGGNVTHLSLDFQQADSQFGSIADSTLTADQIFDQQWAIAVLNCTLKKLEDDHEKAGTSERFQMLRGFVIGDHTGIVYADVARELGISEVAAKKAASRMRGRFRELLREEIAQTVTSPEEVDAEIQSLFAVFQKG